LICKECRATISDTVEAGLEHNKKYHRLAVGGVKWETKESGLLVLVELDLATQVITERVHSFSKEDQKGERVITPGDSLSVNGVELQLFRKQEKKNDVI